MQIQQTQLQNHVIFLTPVEMARSLGIHAATLDALVVHDAIPHTYMRAADSREYQLRFNSFAIDEWMNGSPSFDFTGDNIASALHSHYQAAYPAALSRLKEIDAQFAEQRRYKGYSLRKVPSKKHGFLYYVRYIRRGKAVPSQWNTHTNNHAAAEKFAEENRERILAAYDAKHIKKEPSPRDILSEYYSQKSPYLDEISVRGRTLSAKTLTGYNNFMNKTLIPFLKEKRVSKFEDITLYVIAELQTRLLKKGNKPQTINRYVSAVRTMFDHLAMKGVIKENVFDKTVALNEKKHRRVRGCHEIEKVKGAFNRKWRDETSYLLNLMIYSTGLRNSEIQRMQAGDFITIKGCRFVDVRRSKTESGVRIVPLHDFVYRKIMEYVKKTGKKEGDYLFSAHGGPNQSMVYKAANAELGRRLGKTENELAKENITFYSGRHYWKTLMNAHGLGDVEEYFMGHRVSKDVAKVYNHHDRQGQRTLAKKAKEVFAIQDKALFGGGG